MLCSSGDGSDTFMLLKNSYLILSLLCFSFLPLSILYAESESEDEPASFSPELYSAFVQFGALAGFNTFSLKIPDDEKKLKERYYGCSFHVGAQLPVFHNYFLYGGLALKRATVLEEEDNFMENNFVREEGDPFLIDPTHAFREWELGMYYFYSKNWRLSAASAYTETRINTYTLYYGRGIRASLGRLWNLDNDNFLGTDLVYSYNRFHCRTVSREYKPVCSQTKGVRHHLGLSLNVSRYIR